VIKQAILLRLGLAFFLLTLMGCAYSFGLSHRALPGGYTQVAIPVFKNNTQDVGIEMYFTDALVTRFARSQVARVTDKDSAPVILEGTIKEVKTESGPAVTNKPGGLLELPEGAVLTTEYRLKVTAEIRLRRKSDDKIVWEGPFTNEKVYAPPRIGSKVVNSANSTYNHNMRMETISRLAEEMMIEAHDRITENF